MEELAGLANRAVPEASGIPHFPVVMLMCCSKIVVQTIIVLLISAFPLIPLVCFYYYMASKSIYSAYLARISCLEKEQVIN